MLALAWRHVRVRPGRFAASAGAIASSVTLVIVAVGLYHGVLAAIAEYPDTLPGVLVVAEKSAAAQLLHSSSVIAPDSERAVTATPGVARVRALHGYLAWIERDGRQAIVFLVGLGRHDRFGRPVRILAGARKPRLNEILVDRTLAHDLGLAVGDAVRLGDATLRVAGITAGGNAVLASYAFVHASALALAGRPRPSYLFVAVAPGTPVADVAARLAALADVRVFTRAAFRRQNEGLARQLLLPLIVVVAVVSAGVTGVIVALTLSTATLERRADWGLLGALGVPSAAIQRLVLAQGVLVGCVGVVVGLAASVALAYGIPAMEPRFAVACPAGVVAAVAAGAVATGLAAAWAPVRVAAGVDPVEAFRA